MTAAGRDGCSAWPTSTKLAWERRGADQPIVVVGAGIVGCSAAYHLLAAGATDVTVLDVVPPGDGTTSAGAGFVSRWAAGLAHFGPAGLALEEYSLAFYRELSENGTDISYANNGNLVLALTEPTWDQWVRGVTSHPRASLGTRILGPAQVAAVTGVVDPAVIRGGALMPEGIRVETRLAVTALAQRIVALGGRMLTGSAATGFVFGPAAGAPVAGVTTAHGTLRASTVLLACGAWTNDVLAFLGLRLPLLRMVATRIVTEPAGVPPTMPVVQCPDLALWIRDSNGGFTWGTIAGYRPAFQVEASEGPISAGQPRSEALLAELVKDTGRVARVFPPLAGAAVRSWSQGMPVYTPDADLIIGRVTGHDNVIVLGGDNETGVSHGPAMGRIAADLTRGADTICDITQFSPDRFDLSDPAKLTEEAVAAEIARRRARVSSRDPWA